MANASVGPDVYVAKLDPTGRLLFQTVFGGRYYDEGLSIGVRLVEEQEVLINGIPRDILVYHIGNRRIWELTARVLQNLLAQLGLEPEEDN